LDHLALKKTIFDGFAGVLGVTFVDYFYIILAIFGIGKLLNNRSFKRIFGAVSSLVLVIFGFLMLKSILGDGVSQSRIISSTNLLQSFFLYFYSLFQIQ